jgi:hypothetical protein
MALGGALDELANKLPYAAVCSSTTGDWEEFYHKNETMSHASDIIQQLIWFSSQVLKGALAEGWSEGRHSEWEAACRKIEDADSAVALVKEFEKDALNWDHINSLWEAQEAQEAQEGKSGPATGELQSSVENADLHLSTPGPELSTKVDPGEAWLMQKRKFAEGPGQGPEDIEASISHFLELNQHLIEDIDHSPRSKETANKAGVHGLGSFGIEATLEYARQSRTSMLSSSKRVHDKHPRKLLKPGLMSAIRSQKLEGRVLDGLVRPSSMGPGIGRAHKGHGLRCRYCGKEFTHPPAHLQHERAHAHIQPREGAKLAVRSIPPVDTSPSVRGGEALSTDDSKSPGSGRPDELSAPEQAALAAKELARLVRRLPAAAWHGGGEGGHEAALQLAADASGTVQSVAGRLAELASLVSSQALRPGWRDDAGPEGEGAAWRARCASCSSLAALTELVGAFERQGLDPAVAAAAAAGGDALQPAGSPSGGDAGDAAAGAGGDADADMDADASSVGSVELGTPCGACQTQTKGIAACFAQGHLFVTPQVGARAGGRGGSNGGVHVRVLGGWREGRAVWGRHRCGRAGVRLVKRRALCVAAMAVRSVSQAASLPCFRFLAFTSCQPSVFVCFVFAFRWPIFQFLATRPACQDCSRDASDGFRATTRVASGVLYTAASLLDRRQ